MTLLRSIRTVTRKYDTEIAESLFLSIVSKHIILKCLYGCNWFFRKTPLSTVFVLIYGARILFLRRVESGSGIIATGLLPNEIRKITLLQAALPRVNILRVNSGVKNVFSLSQWIFSLQIFLQPKTILRIFCVIDRLNRRKKRFFLSCIAMDTIVYHCLYKRVLDNRRISAVFFSSDYTSDAVPLVNLARSRGIKTIFIPHANITKSHKVPPLTYSLSVLTGQSIIEIYQSRGESKGEVLLLGIPSPYRPMHLALTQRKLRIGIFLTSFTDEAVLNQIIIQCISRLDVAQIIIRPHPAKLVLPDFNRLDKKLLCESIVVVSEENSLHEDLENVHLVIAGNSSVHLECLRFGVPSLYFHGLDAFLHDVNGFLENEILYSVYSIESDTPKNVKNYYQDSNWQARFRHYDAGYGFTEHELIGTLSKKLEAVLENGS